MNKTLIKHSTRAMGAALLGMFAFAAVAQTTSLTVDALANCVNATGGETNFPSILVNLLPGTYAVKVKSSTATYCENGACPHPDTAITVFDGTTYIADTFIVKATAATNLSLPAGGLVWAYFLDTNCSDNAGSSVLRFTKKN